MSDPIQQAIDAANKLSAEQKSSAITVTPTQGGAVAVAKPAAKFSMETLSSDSITVDQWVKVKELYFHIGDDKAIVPEFKVSIDMTDGSGFLVKQSIKAGNPAQYWSTYDGETCPGVGSWAQAVSKAQALDGKARPYRAVDIPMELLEDVVVGGKVVAKTGTKLGYSTSTTNWANWETFYKAVANAGLIGKSVEVKVTPEARSNKAGNAWGVMKFELIGEVQADSE